MSDLAVAETIRAQLGGVRFSIMTGARQFVGSGSMLQFIIPLTKGINKVRIELTPMDVYTMTFYRITHYGKVVVKVETRENVYCDQLQEVFTAVTGLYTHL